MCKKKLHDYCDVERKRVDGHKTRIYRLKDQTQILACMSKEDEPEYVEFIDDADFEIMNKFPFTIRNKKTHHTPKIFIRKGFQTINLRGHQYYLQYIIAAHFIDNPKDYRFVRHINGIKDDNRLENLEWNRFKE